MPTGYTANIEKGITFKEFTMNCARAFGALITMRDEPHDAKIPEKFEPSDYHVKALEKAKKELERLNSLSDEKIIKLRDKEFEKELADWERRNEAKLELKKKYSAMLVKVEKWTPPTSDHIGLKKFMKEQITMSIDADCSMKYSPKPTKQSIADWKQIELESAERDITYHEKELNEEIKRCQERTDWVQNLIKSLD